MLALVTLAGGASVEPLPSVPSDSHVAEVGKDKKCLGMEQFNVVESACCKSRALV